MKKTFPTTIVLSLMVLLLSFNLQGKDFKGVVTYKITYPGAELTPQMQTMMPKMMTYYVKGDMAKTVIDMGNMGQQMQIMNGNSKTIYNLFDMMGQKFYTVTTKTEIEEELEKEPEPQIDYIDEIKEIAGYDCKKAVITIDENGEKNSFLVYYNSELGSKALNFDNPYFNDIDGLLMEFEMLEGQFKMKLEAVEVHKKNVKDSEFEIPEEFQEKTKEELRQSFGGGM